MVNINRPVSQTIEAGSVRIIVDNIISGIETYPKKGFVK
jgi:hypothetical protein